MENNYPKAYREVIEILNFVSKESINKIPRTIIDTFNAKMDKNYEFKVDLNKSFEEQNILNETKAILANIFRDYWATAYQKEKITLKEKYDRRKIEEEKKSKYNSDDIFKKRNTVKKVEETQKSTREQLSLKQREYCEELRLCSAKGIEGAFKILEEKRKRVKSKIQNESKNTDNLDEEIKKVFELMSKYEQDIKQIFIKNNETITHITDVPPQNMINGKISRSINRANSYETERGNWVFASSKPIKGENPYVARSPRSGMVLIDSNTYIYGSDNMIIEYGKQGRNRVVLKNLNYIYKINPGKFKPVVTLKKNKNGMPFFDFSEEWISEEEVNINDSRQVIDVEEITDITEVIENYQVLCDINGTREAIKIKKCSSRSEAMQKIIDSIKNGKLRYINGEANINVGHMIENIEKEDIISNAKLLKKELFLVQEIGEATVSINTEDKDRAKQQIQKDVHILQHVQEL